MRSQDPTKVRVEGLLRPSTDLRVGALVAPDLGFPRWRASLRCSVCAPQLAFSGCTVARGFPWREELLNLEIIFSCKKHFRQVC